MDLLKRLGKGLGIVGMSLLPLAPLAAINTVKPEEVPEINPIFLGGFQFSYYDEGDDEKSLIGFIYDFDQDGREDARFIYPATLGDETTALIGKLIMYYLDWNKNSVYEDSEKYVVEYETLEKKSIDS